MHDHKSRNDVTRPDAGDLIPAGGAPGKRTRTSRIQRKESTSSSTRAVEGESPCLDLGDMAGDVRDLSYVAGLQQRYGGGSSHPPVVQRKEAETSPAAETSADHEQEFQEESGSEGLDEDGKGSGAGWTAAGVAKIIAATDPQIIEDINKNKIKIIRFQKAFDKWRYDDGHVEEIELTTLRGNTRKADKAIRLAARLSAGHAASTLFHEMRHMARPQAKDRAEGLQERNRCACGDRGVPHQAGYATDRAGIPDPGWQGGSRLHHQGNHELQALQSPGAETHRSALRRRGAGARLDRVQS
jgi:hypothetical protein